MVGFPPLFPGSVGAGPGMVVAVVVGVSFSVGGGDEVHGHFGVADSLGWIAAGAFVGVGFGWGRGSGHVGKQSMRRRNLTSIEGFRRRMEEIVVFGRSGLFGGGRGERPRGAGGIFVLQYPRCDAISRRRGGFECLAYHCEEAPSVLLLLLFGRRA